MTWLEEYENEMKAKEEERKKCREAINKLYEGMGLFADPIIIGFKENIIRRMYNQPVKE